MEGDEFSETRGVIPRAVQQIFRAAEKLGAQGWEVSAWCRTERGARCLAGLSAQDIKSKFPPVCLSSISPRAL